MIFQWIEVEDAKKRAKISLLTYEKFMKILA